MLRKLLGVVVAMALPSLLAGQAPAAPAPAMSKVAPAHAMATQVQGEVVEVDEPDGINNQEGVDESDGQNNDVEDGDVDQEGCRRADGLNNEVDAGDQVEQEGENEDGDTPAPPPPRRASSAKSDVTGRNETCRA